jgi:hypothetical protein
MLKILIRSGKKKKKKKNDVTLRHDNIIFKVIITPNKVTNYKKQKQLFPILIAHAQVPSALRIIKLHVHKSTLFI